MVYLLKFKKAFLTQLISLDNTAHYIYNLFLLIDIVKKPWLILFIGYVPSSIMDGQGM